MTVFNAFLQVLRRNIGLVILFTGIMLVMGLTAFRAMPDTSGSFAALKPAMKVVNQGSETTLTRAFNDYLQKHATMPDVGTSEHEIDDALYYQSLTYVVYLPKDFTQKVLNGEKPVVEVKSRGMADSVSAEVLVNRFLRLATGYGQYFSTEDELVQAVESSVELETEITLTNQHDQKTLQHVSSLYNFGSYTLLAGACYVITMVLATFSETNVRKRTVVSATNPIRINTSLTVGCALIVGLLVALNVVLVSVLLPAVSNTGRAGLYVVNIVAFGLPVLASGFLLAKITNNKEALSAIMNVVALASSFLCGAFIPQNLLPDSVTAVGRILPTFYYVENNNELATMPSFTGTDLTHFWLNIGIQIGFAMVLWLASIAVSRLRPRR